MRPVLFLIALIAVFSGPWWAVILAAAIVSIRYRAYEMLIVAAIADALWLPMQTGFGVPLMTVAVTVILIVFEPVRRELFLGMR